MSKIKNGGLDQYGAEPFEQQQFGTPGVEMVKVLVGAVNAALQKRPWRGRNDKVETANELRHWGQTVFVRCLFDGLFISTVYWCIYRLWNKNNLRT